MPTAFVLMIDDLGLVIEAIASGREFFICDNRRNLRMISSLCASRRAGAFVAFAAACGFACPILRPPAAPIRDAIHQSHSVAMDLHDKKWKGQAKSIALIVDD